MGVRTPGSVLATCALLCLGVTARAGDAPVRVAVLPVSLLAAPPATGERVRGRLVEALRGAADVEILDAAAVDRAVDAQCGTVSRWDCLEQEAPLLAVGQALGARLVVASNLAVMGEARVLKLRVVDLSSETISGEVVEMSGQDDEAVLERFAALGARLLPRAEPAPEPAAAPWPVWVGVGVAMVAVAAGTTVGVLLATGALDPGGEAGGWDARVSLP